MSVLGTLLLAWLAVTAIVLAANVLLRRLRVLAVRPILFAEVLSPSAKNVHDEALLLDAPLRRNVRRALLAWQAAEPHPHLQVERRALMRAAQRALVAQDAEQADRLDRQTRALWRDLATPLPSPDDND